MGPMGIKGVTSDIGIMTFRVNRERNKPTDDSILRFDVYTEKEGNYFTVLSGRFPDGKESVMSELNLTLFLVFLIVSLRK